MLQVMKVTSAGELILIKEQWLLLKMPIALDVELADVVTENDLQLIVNCLRTIKSIASLNCSFKSKQIKAKHIKIIAELYQLPHLPANTNINLDDNHIGNSGLIILARVLKNSNFKNDCSFHLRHNKITGVGLKYLLELFSTLKFASALTLNLSHNQIGDNIFTEYAQPFKKIDIPDKFCLDLANNQLNGFSILSLLDGISLPRQVKLVFSANPIGELGVNAIIDACLYALNKPAMRLEELQIELVDCGLCETDVFALTRLLSHPLLPQKLLIDLSLINCSKFLSAQTLKTMLIAIAKNKQATVKLSLNFANQQAFGDYAAMHLAEAITSNQLPEALTINLTATNMTEKGLVMLSNALGSKYVPPNLHLIVAENDFTKHAVNVLVQNLRAAKHNNALHLDLSGIHLTTDMASDFLRLMKVNTNIVNLVLTTFDIALAVSENDEFLQKQMQLIELCCQRNKLLYKYPNYSSLIKEFCANYGLFDPLRAAAIVRKNVFTPLTALFTCVQAYNQNVDLPSEIEAFHNKLQAITTLEQGPKLLTMT